MRPEFGSTWSLWPRYVHQLRIARWFLADSFRTSTRPVVFALVMEFGSFLLQAVAYAVLVTALSDPGGQLESLSTATASIVLGCATAGLLLGAEVVKYAAQRSKYRLAYDYEVDALSRVLRYAHRANRFDAETIKNLVSRLPQVSARVAMATVDAIVPSVVGFIAIVVLLIAHPAFTVVLFVCVVFLVPVYYRVVLRGRRATQGFYSPEGLGYIRRAALLMGPAGAAGEGKRDVQALASDARVSLKLLETRRATPNLTYLVTGLGLALTLGVLVGYSVLLGRKQTDAADSLLQIFFVLRFVYVGVGGLSGALSKIQILVPRVEPVMWALEGGPPPAGGRSPESLADLGGDDVED